MRLADIDDPAQLRTLSARELEAIGREIRDFIVDTVSMKGGHLASGLGVVELTLALLANFDPSRDKIVWDVGHQCYPYKILTGRQETFPTVRQQNGISGFPSRAESRYDAFGTGHASTSISAALGFAKARDLLGESYKVVAVIGDGALTGGLAWEALNNAGVAGSDLLVILNDNEMSISPSEGALARHLTMLKSQLLLHRLEDETQRLLTHVPIVGSILSKTGEVVKRGITTWVSPLHGALFEALGFQYIGPVDGHDLPLLKELLARARALPGPILLHIMTRKGKGYAFAEDDACSFHGVGAFDVSTGRQSIAAHPTFTSAFADALVRCAEREPRLVAITAAMPDGTGLSEFAARFPDRCFDVGIAEEHAVIFAAGLAAGGMKPVVAVYSTFLQRAYDQILHDVCLQKLPVIFAVDRAGIVGPDGATHQGIFDLAYLRHIPNLVLMAPRNGEELGRMLLFALDSGLPCAIRYPRQCDPGHMVDRGEPIRMGKAELLREGRDIAIFGIGHVLARCLESARALERQGLSAAVINARFVTPLDEEMVLAMASRVKALVTVEEHVRAGGFGSAVLETLNARGARADHVLTVALPNEFIPHGDADALRRAYRYAASDLADRILGFYRSAVALDEESLRAGC